MKNKSLEYIRNRIMNKDNINLDVDIDKAIVISPKEFLTFGEKDKIISNITIEDKPVSVEVTYNPTADFEYFTTYTLVHDGTFAFIKYAISECLYGLLTLRQYNTNVGIPREIDKYRYYYTMGDIILINEFDDKFAPADKPWMKERTTVLVPLIYNYEEI